jgi:hypothetical protein
VPCSNGSAASLPVRAAFARTTVHSFVVLARPAHARGRARASLAGLGDFDDDLVSGNAVPTTVPVGRDHLHRQTVLARQPPGRQLGSSSLGPYRLGAGQVRLGRQAIADRQSLDIVVDPLRGLDAFGHLRAGLRGHEHIVPDGGRHSPGSR